MMTNFIPGFILLDKMVGISSAKALYPIKKLVPKGQKVGHAGTLDPFASGLLIVAVGRATKSLQYIVALSKTYEFTVKWGEATDTDDLTGKIINQSIMIPSLNDIEKALEKFNGPIQQTPPKYSAISLNGMRAYDLARKGVDFELQSREVIIYNLDITHHNALYTSFIMQCSKGCYVRSIARDIAENLGSYAHVTVLKRTAIGDFNIENAHRGPMDHLPNIIPLSNI